MKIKISINKIQIIRPESNSKIFNSDLNTDWSIDYTEVNNKIVKYLCIMNIIDDISLNFAIQGLIECEDHQILNRSSEFTSPVLNKSIEVIMNMLNATKESTIQINPITDNSGPISHKIKLNWFF